MQKKPNRTILLVDDEPGPLDVLRLQLELMGYEVMTASGPVEGLERHAEKPCFLVITDIAMPGMDGYDFIKHLQAAGSMAQIALMTGFGYNPEHTLVRIHGEHKYPILFKPFEFKKPKFREVIETAHAAYHADLAG